MIEIIGKKIGEGMRGLLRNEALIQAWPFDLSRVKIVSNPFV
ncbi:hypothetical protein [Alkalicoccus saliphilus]|nr:hypothetical protein [Alkalicoccus saliphilus]